MAGTFCGMLPTSKRFDGGLQLTMRHPSTYTDEDIAGPQGQRRSRRDVLPLSDHKVAGRVRKDLCKISSSTMKARKPCHA
jgi:hypothetical protein